VVVKCRNNAWFVAGFYFKNLGAVFGNETLVEVLIKCEFDKMAPGRVVSVYVLWKVQVLVPNDSPK
jgi:hypothetical protein